MISRAALMSLCDDVMIIRPDRNDKAPINRFKILHEKSLENGT